MKYVIIVLFLASSISIICGFIMEKLPYAQKLIGFGTLGLFFVVIPLFIFQSWKGKKIEDYMLTKENLDKMRNN